MRAALRQLLTFLSGSQTPTHSLGFVGENNATTQFDLQCGSSPCTLDPNAPNIGLAVTPKALVGQ